MGIYPHLNIIDAAVSVLRGGKQHSVFFSRPLNMERMNTYVGGFSVEVVEPLKRIRLKVEETEGIALDVEFEGRAFPIEEPRFTRRQGPRMLMDVTRMTQNGRWSGKLRLDGQEITVSPDSWTGTRDRSWGVRDIAMVRQHRMCTGTFGPGLSFATTVLQLANGHYHKAGFVVRDGVEEDIADIDILALVDADGVTVRGGQCRITLGSGECLEIDCETVGSFAHVYGDSYLTSENLSVARWTDPAGIQTGFCDLECSINAQAGTGLMEAHASRGVLLENGLRLMR